MTFCKKNTDKSLLINNDEIFDMFPSLKDGDTLTFYESRCIDGEYFQGEEFMCINMTKIGEKLVMNVSTNDPIMQLLIKNSDMADCVLRTPKATA